MRISDWSSDVCSSDLLGFPSLSRPGILDALNHQDFGYRWVTRFIALDKTIATKTLTSLRRQWFNKRKSVTALLREVLYNQPAQLLDSDADNKVLDAEQALQALGGDHVRSEERRVGEECVRQGRSRGAPDQ